MTSLGITAVVVANALSSFTLSWITAPCAGYRFTLRNLMDGDKSQEGQTMLGYSVGLATAGSNLFTDMGISEYSRYTMAVGTHGIAPGAQPNAFYNACPRRGTESVCKTTRIEGMSSERTVKRMVALYGGHPGPYGRHHIALIDVAITNRFLDSKGSTLQSRGNPGTVTVRFVPYKRVNQVFCNHAGHASHHRHYREIPEHCDSISPTGCIVDFVGMKALKGASGWEVADHAFVQRAIRTMWLLLLNCTHNVASRLVNGNPRPYVA